MADFQKAQTALEQRGFAVRVFSTKQEAVHYLNDSIDGVSVGIGGSATIQEMALHDALAEHNQVHWHWINGPEERTAAATADVYLSSVNALAETGEIVNIDGVGNRLASTLYGHKKVYFVVGRNKIVPTFDKAVWRARNVAAPQNAARLKRKTPCAIKGDRCYDCKSPERLCRGMTVLWGPMLGMAAEVILIDEDLGL